MEPKQHGGLTEGSRINFNIEPELYDRLERCLPRGIRSHVFRALLEMVIYATEKHGQVIIGAILGKHIRLYMPEVGKDVNLNGQTSSTSRSKV
jgi:hypothetical protein